MGAVVVAAGGNSIICLATGVGVGYDCVAVVLGSADDIVEGIREDGAFIPTLDSTPLGINTFGTNDGVTGFNSALTLSTGVF